MAVSGRKQPKVLGSVEGSDRKCEQCLTTDEYKEAHGFCITCQEYLCKICRDCHKKTKALCDHKIIGKDQFHKIKITRKSYNECTEHCTLHQKEIIKFYCKSHAILGCNDCMTIGHRACEIDYIPEKCVGIADGKEYEDIMMILSEKLVEAKKVLNKAKSSRSDINDINEKIIKEIAEFRVEINVRLDQMQQDILNNIEQKTSRNKEIVEKVIDMCGSSISDMKKLQSRLRANKSNNQNGQLYIGIKQTESALKSEDLIEAEEKIFNMNNQYSFRRNADLENLLSMATVFGEFINHPNYQSTTKKNTIDHLSIKNEIDVKTKSDRSNCWITGCAVLPPYQLVLADYKNNKIKVVSVMNKLVLQEKDLDSHPWDIAVMSENEIAVTLPDLRRIEVMTTVDKIFRYRSIKVNGKCYGIDFHQDLFYIACLLPSNTVVLTKQGNVLISIPLNFLSFSYLPYIAVRKYSNHLYISDGNNNSVVSVSLQGGVTATYKHEDFEGPKGMCLLDDGSMLVCCYSNNTIHQVKDNLVEGNIVLKGIDSPWSMCYSARNDEVYVGCKGNLLTFLSTK